MIKKIYGQHTFCFSVLTIVLSIITLATGGNIEFSNELIVPFVCLFLILSVGISHGAMDNYKANKLLLIYKINNKSIFFIVYILISNFVEMLTFHLNKITTDSKTNNPRLTGPWISFHILNLSNSKAKFSVSRTIADLLALYAS